MRSDRLWHIRVDRWCQVTTPLTYDLDESVTTVLNGSGNGTAIISPGQPAAPGSGVGAARYSGLAWEVAAVAVSVATNVAEAQASVYVSRGILASGAANFQGQTAQGSTGDTCSLSATLIPGDWITVTWTGGDAGSLATMRVTGSVTAPGAM
jgi:hypothetical protein